MDIILCTCEAAPYAHHHASATVYEDRGVRTVGPPTRTHHTYPDGSPAEVRDVVRWVDWRDEGQRLRDHVESRSYGEVKRAALERWDRACLEDGHAVRPDKPKDDDG